MSSIWLVINEYLMNKQDNGGRKEDIGLFKTTYYVNVGEFRNCRVNQISKSLFLIIINSQ